jgi:hypothetical protein
VSTNLPSSAKCFNGLCVVWDSDPGTESSGLTIGGSVVGVGTYLSIFVVAVCLFVLDLSWKQHCNAVCAGPSEVMTRTMPEPGTGSAIDLLDSPFKELVRRRMARGVAPACRDCQLDKGKVSIGLRIREA